MNWQNYSRSIGILALAIAQLREQNLAQWQDLLKSVGLEDLADKPFIACCTPNP
jgi:hypothetical protein